MICNINTMEVQGSSKKKKTNSDKIVKNNFRGGGGSGCFWRESEEGGAGKINTRAYFQHLGFKLSVL